MWSRINLVNDECLHINLVRNYFFSMKRGNIVPIVDVCRHCNYVLMT